MDEHHMNELHSLCESDVFDNMHKVTPFGPFFHAPTPFSNFVIDKVMNFLKI
jgi:hypothetical protein